METKVLTIETSQAQKSVKDLRNELKELRDQLLNVEEGTEEYNRLVQDAAGIQHQLKEQMEEVNASAMDFGQIIGNITTTMSGVTASFQVASATLNLFGIESEDVAKSIKTMQNMMALTQGLAAIDNQMKAVKRLNAVLKTGTPIARAFGMAMTPKVFLAVEIAVVALTAAFSKLRAREEEVIESNKKLASLRTDEGIRVIELKQRDYNDALDKELDLKRRINAINGVLKSETLKQEKLIYESRLNDYKIEQLAAQKRLDKAQQEFSILNKIAEAGASRLNTVSNLDEKTDDFFSIVRQNQELLKAVGVDVDYILEKGRLRLSQNINDINKLIKRALPDYEASLEIAKKDVESWNAAVDNLNESIKRTQDQIDIEAAAELASKKKKKADDEAAKIKAYEEMMEEVAKLNNEIADRLWYETFVMSLQDKLLANMRDNWQDVANEIAVVEEEEEALVDNTLLENTLDVLANLRSEFSYLYQLGFDEELHYLELALNTKLITEEEYLKLRTELYKRNQREVANYALATVSAGFDVMYELFNGLGELQDTSLREGFETNKKYQIAAATMSMLSGITAAIAGLFTTKSGPWDIALAVLQAAAIATAGGLEIAQIAKMKFDGGNTANVNTNALGNLIAPIQYTKDVQGAAIEGAIKDTKVYVTEQDISSTQHKVQVAQTEATF